MDFTNYLADRLIKATVGTIPYSPSAKVYLSLHTSDPTKEGLSVGEVDAPSYNRQEINFTESVDGVCTNDAQIDFSMATTNWGDVGWVAIMDAESSGYMLYFTELDNAKNILTGDQLRFQVNEVKLTLT